MTDSTRLRAYKSESRGASEPAAGRGPGLLACKRLIHRDRDIHTVTVTVTVTSGSEAPFTVKPVTRPSDSEHRLPGPRPAERLRLRLRLAVPLQPGAAAPAAGQRPPPIAGGRTRHRDGVWRLAASESWSRR